MADVQATTSGPHGHPNPLFTGHYKRGCRCTECVFTWRTYQNNRRAKRIASGACAGCNLVPPREGKRLCNDCWTKHRAIAHKSYAHCKTKPNTRPNCSIAGCELKTRSHSCPWCETHYYRNRRHGDPRVRLNMQYTVDESVFDPMTGDGAWLLGLIWADGWMRRDGGGVGITNTDLPILKYANGLFSPACDDLITEHDNPAHYKLTLFNRHIWQRLADFGCVPNKSLVIEWPKGLPGEFDWAFVRGVLDGDGSACLHRSSERHKTESLRLVWYSGSRAFAESLSARLASKGCNPHLQTKEPEQEGWHQTYAVHLQAIESVRIAVHGMYPSWAVPSIEYKRDACRTWLFTPRVGRGNWIRKPKEAVR